MKYLPLLFVLLLLSCSKSQESSSSADSTGVSGGVSDSSGEKKTMQLAELTTEEADRVGVELFMWVRSQIGARLALQEEFKIEGKKFKYRLLRHNGSDAGMQTQEYSGSRSMNDDEYAEWEADSTNAGGTPPSVQYTETNYYYVSEIDTFEVEGEMVTYYDGSPEARPKKLYVEIKGRVKFKNANYVHYGEPVFSIELHELGNSEDYPVSEFYVDFSQPLTFSRDDLYVKAKIAELTDADVVGLSKEELGFVRNDIFAHHGHTFKTPKMVKHYDQLDWYEAVIEDAVPYLNSFEKRNVDFIKKKEG